MIHCGVVRRHADALVDGELDTSVQVEFEAHLAACPVCREHAAFARVVKDAVRRELSAPVAPAALRDRIRVALENAPAATPRATSDDEALSSGALRPRRDGSDVAFRWMLVPPRYAVPTVAAAVLLVVVALPSDEEVDADDAAAVAALPVFEDVVRRHASDHPAEIEGSPTQMAGWFRGKLEFPVRPVELADDAGGDVRLLGARISNIREHQAAAFFYEVHGRRVTVVVFEPPRETFLGAERVRVGERDVYYRNVRGYTVPVMQHEGLGYAFTGDLDSRSMIQLAASARVH